MLAGETIKPRTFSVVVVAGITNVTGLKSSSEKSYLCKTFPLSFHCALRGNFRTVQSGHVHLLCEGNPKKTSKALLRIRELGFLYFQRDTV